MSNIEKLLADKGYQVWSVAPDEMVFNAIRIMAEKDIGALPVVQSGKLVGIISERDYTRKVILKDRSSKNTRVMEIMTTDVYHIAPSMGIEECMALMSRHHFRHLPVVLDGELIGMVSITDVVKEIIHHQQITIDHLEHAVSWGESY